MSSNPHRNDPREWGDVESIGDKKGSDTSQIHNVGQRITNIYKTREGKRAFQDGQGNAWYEKEPGEFHMSSGQKDVGYQAPIKIRFGNFEDKEPEAESTGGGGLLAAEPGSVVGATGGGILNEGPTTPDIVGGYDQMFAFTPVTAGTHINPLVAPQNWMYQTGGYTPPNPGQYVVPNIMTTLV